MDASGLMIQVSNDIFKRQIAIVFISFQVFIINSVKALWALTHTVKAVKYSLEIGIHRNIRFVNSFHNPIIFLNTDLNFFKNDIHLYPSLR